MPKKIKSKLGGRQKPATIRSVAVIGGGPAGLSAAYNLAKAGIRVDVYEASSQVGGMARSINLWGHTVDIGPHRFFSKDPRVNTLWLELIGNEYRMVKRRTRIFFRGKLFNYPIEVNNALSRLGMVEALLCVASYLRQQLRFQDKSDLNTFEDWVTSRFGKRLYRHFFKTYTAKLWGIDPKLLDAEFAAQRIGKLSVWEAAKAAFFGNGAQKHKTLVDEFAYPNRGTGQLYDAMSQKIEDLGSKILLNSPVQSLKLKNNRVAGIKLESGTEVEYDNVISSMPITLLLDKLPKVPAAVVRAAKILTFRNTILVYLMIDSSKVFPDTWLYIHSGDLRVGRITNFRNWGPILNHSQTGTVLSLEFWCNDRDDIWKWDDSQLIDLAKKEIVLTKLAREGQIVDGKVIRVPRCYPVYKLGYRKDLVKVESYISTIKNLQIIGRYGAFKYNNQDHSMLMGILAADNIINNSRHDLWAINSDLEYHESSMITQNGLRMN